MFTSLPDWWTLVSDQTALTAGGNAKGDALNLVARSDIGNKASSRMDTRQNGLMPFAPALMAEARDQEL
jgi:hypothetical protein